MPGATFKLTTKYAASGLVVADGAMTAGSRVLSSATAAFSIFDERKTIVVEGAGAAGVDLTTRIKKFISATKVELVDAASTTVTGSDLTYVVGIYRLFDLLRNGDVDGNTYQMLNASRLQIQVNSRSPTGNIYVGGKEVSPTNCGLELTAPGSSDNSFSSSTGAGLTTADDYLTSDVDEALVNVYWQGVAQVA